MCPLHLGRSNTFNIKIVNSPPIGNARRDKHGATSVCFSNEWLRCSPTAFLAASLRAALGLFESDRLRGANRQDHFTQQQISLYVAPHTCVFLLAFAL